MVEEVRTMLLTLFSFDKRRPLFLFRWLTRLVERSVQPVLILPKGSLSVEDGLKLGKLLSDFSRPSVPILLGFAESLAQAEAFCKEVKKGKLGQTVPRVLPVILNATRLKTDAKGKDFSDQLEGLEKDWENSFPLTCFIEFGRDPSHLSEASGRTSLFELSSLVAEVGFGKLRLLKKAENFSSPIEWTSEVLSSLRLE
ncbi:hypothetical protein LEP1GSC058_2802 [Leptospira fainei serovar Hurstbridge str. BUT 6]|uniref:Uncharacterized protein n=2 Tax=Leptospira fainei TaxID=48782 RepID=S3VC64_9LEPT|nr:hypothetical protein LEP1GSC058_2802 [Leptospira fainei serovar Hurstbridge str. BUT 6]